jgi:Putative auto-transporter adhesin, head GIN domain
MLRYLLPAATVIAALALAGCDVGDDGPQTTQTRDVAHFTRVDSSGAADLRLRIGKRQTVRVLAGEKVIDDVRTEVRDGTLELRYEHHGFGGGDVVVEATVPALTGIEVTGSGDVEAAGLDAKALAIRSDGSGDVDLEGDAERLTLDMDGSGDADLAELDARSARVAVGGSGDARVNAGERLDVAIDGSGDVRYRGDAAVSKRLDGSGELSRAG